MFTVTWTKDALNELTELWTDAPAGARAAITDSVVEIERGLRISPLSMGESRPGNRRVVFYAGLGVNLQVLPEDRLVTIGRIWRLQRKER